MKTILIVDDEFSVAETLQEFLGWAGYATVTAANGKAGLELVRSRRPDLVLLDYMLPIMDGLQVLYAIRADPATRDLPVIIMTAAPAGIVGIEPIWQAMLVKPFDAPRLLRLIKELLPP